MSIYTFWNGPMPTTAAQLAVTTGTAIKTMLQLKPFNVMKLLGWSVSFDGSAAAAGIQVGVLETGTIFGTVTAAADADIIKFDGNEGAVASVAGLTLSTTGTGYTCTSEGSIVATKMFGARFLQPYESWEVQYPLGREPKLIIGNCYRMRITAAAAVNALCSFTVEI